MQTNGEERHKLKKIIGGLQMKQVQDNSTCRRLMFALLFCATAHGANAEDLKVYISADMEGVAGVVGPEQMGPNGFEYGQFRKFMTAEEIGRRRVGKECVR